MSWPHEICVVIWNLGIGHGRVIVRWPVSGSIEQASKMSFEIHPGIVAEKLSQIEKENEDV